MWSDLDKSLRDDSIEGDIRKSNENNNNYIDINDDYQILPSLLDIDNDKRAVDNLSPQSNSLPAEDVHRIF